MGAWGYGYKDNDNYYNLAETFTEPLIQALVDQIEANSDLSDFRARFIWTINVLKSSEEDLFLSEKSLKILRLCIEVIGECAIESSAGWRDPDEYLRVVQMELTIVEEWLNKFKDLGLLEDRTSALLEAISKNEE